MNNKKKSQIALEYLILMGVVAAVLSPLVYSQLNEYVINQRINDAIKLANDIAKAANSLYSLGPGNQKYMYINVPKGMVDVNIYQREISFTMETAQGTQDIILVSQGYVTGVIPTEPGTYRISMRVLGNGVVLIGFPYCGIMSVDKCNENDLNPLVYLNQPYDSHISLYNVLDSDGGMIDIANYSLCCKSSIYRVSEDEATGDAATLFWIDNELSGHLALSSASNYSIPVMIQSNITGASISCIYDVNKTIDFCSELGTDYYCVATVEDNYIESGSDIWEGTIISASHISDCDGDFDDYSIKICCIIPP